MFLLVQPQNTGDCTRTIKKRFNLRLFMTIKYANGETIFLSEVFVLYFQRNIVEFHVRKQILQKVINFLSDFFSLKFQRFRWEWVWFLSPGPFFFAKNLSFPLTTFFFLKPFNSWKITGLLEKDIGYWFFLLRRRAAVTSNCR